MRSTGGLKVFVVATLGEVGVGKTSGDLFSNMDEGQVDDLQVYITYFYILRVGLF